MKQLSKNYRLQISKLILGLFLVHLSYLSVAQIDTLKKITYSAYGELYYSYDFSNPQNHEKPNFVYNHKRHNELNANLLLLKANFSDTSSRANFGLMAGNYAHYNLSSEPFWAQFIFEANMGIKLSKKHTIWLDAGIMPSHIGFESAISADCWTLTRSILAENSPYYETGIKTSYISNKENLSIAFLVLNGWQRTHKPNDIQKPSYGLQFNFKPTNTLILNYSNFMGTVQADTLNAIRVFHNFFAQYEPDGKLGAILGFDIGTDKYNANDYGIWLSPVLMLRYSLSEQIKMAFRAEYYSDKHQIIVNTYSPAGLQATGISANLDYAITSKVNCRLEGKYYKSSSFVFPNNSNNNFALTTNLTMRL